MTEPITPSRFPSSRSRRDRRSLLRLMGLGPIGDIGSSSFSTVTPSRTWETATDWNNAVSEDGIVHENVTNTDHNDETILKMGYSAEAIYLSSNAILYWPGHEDSGSTANDLTGNGNDGSGGSTPGVTGLLGTTAWSSGSGDTVDVGLSSIPGDARTVTGWFNADWGSGSGNQILYSNDGRDFSIHYNNNNNSGGYEFQHAGGNSISTGVTRTQEWIYFTTTYDGSTFRVYVDAVEENNRSSSTTVNTSPKFEMYKASPEGKNSAGDFWNIHYYDRALTQSEIQTLYDVVNAESSLTTATKGYASSQAPDISNVSYTLNGETIAVDVIGSPGTASEEVKTQSLTGASSYALSWNSTHTDFRVRVRMDTSDPTVTPTFDSITLQ